MHTKNIIHRDIKPDNFLVGIGKKQHIIYVIDFGLAKQYRDKKTGNHIPIREGKSLTGTARYASLNTHLGVEQSRRDDLESIGYILVYLTLGSLPWQGLPVKTKKEKYEKIKELKSKITVESLCKNCPPEFAEYINFCRKLGFVENPDYAYLRKLLKNVLVKQGYEYDYVFDWLLQKNHLNRKQKQTTEEKKAEDKQEKEGEEPEENRKEEEKKHGVAYKVLMQKQPVHIIKENGGDAKAEEKPQENK